jgi:hypothetical protein
VNSDDLAWVAGFLEGEGTFYAHVAKRGTLRLTIRVTSTDLDVVEKLQGLVPTSRVQGPYRPSKGSLGLKDHWQWGLHARPLVVKLATQVRPLMGIRRQGQIDVLLQRHAEYPYLRNRFPAPAAHGTRTRYDRGCRCEPCHAAENAYQREGRAIRKARAASIAGGG